MPSPRIPAKIPIRIKKERGYSSHGRARCARERDYEKICRKKRSEKASHHFKVETPRKKTTSGDCESDEEEKMQTSDDSGRKDGDEDVSDNSEVPDFDGSTEDGTSDED